MAKKIVVVLILGILISGVAFAQEYNSASIKNWISGEVGLLGFGARYERMLTDQLSVGANAYWSSLFFFWNELEVGGSVRYYLFPSDPGFLKGFFVGGGLGFHMHTGTYEYAPGSSWFGSIYGVAITPEVGWKLDLGDPGAFFIQPGLKIPVTFGKLESWGLYDGGFKVGFGIVPYFGMGFAF